MSQLLIENSGVRGQNSGVSTQHSALSSLPDREPIRHLLIGSPDIINRTVHQLHNLRYAEAGLWSPAIALSGEQLILTLNPGEVMRVLVKYGVGRS